MESESDDHDMIDKFVNFIGSQLEDDGALKDVSSKFAECESDYERAEFVLQLCDERKVIQVPSVTDSILKCAELAAKRRNEGNDYFKRKRDNDALAFYTESIIYAPADSETRDLALGYANRSAVLFHQKKYSACLNDIRRALNADYPKELHYKLYDRQAKSLRALKKYQLACQAYQNLGQSLQHAKLDDEKQAEWKKEVNKATAAYAHLAFKGMSVSTAEIQDQVVKNKMAPRLGANPNLNFPSLTRRCDVDYSASGGRFITAAEDIGTGEVLMVERPFASVLLPDQYGIHCHVCYVRCDVMIPCKTCTLALYCGDTCRSLADASFHRYECSVLEAIHKSGLGKFGHLALRAITVKDADFFHSVRATYQKTSQTTVARLRGSDTEGKYKQDDYTTIHSLVGHSKQRKPGDLFRRAVGAAFLVKCLQTTDFFHNEKDNTFVTYICGLILSHLQSFPCNAHEISELQLDNNYVAESISYEIGAGIYSTLSLFNHSCAPMATRHFYGDTCVVRSIRIGRQGEEISDNYGTVFAVQNKDDREEKLKPQYYFDCQCVACTENWPMYLEIPHENPILACTSCHTAVASQATKCPNCSVAVDTTEKLRFFKLATEKYHSGLKKLLLGDVTEAMSYFSKALNLFHANVRLPWRDVNNCQEGLKQCFSILGNCYELPLENSK